MFKVNYNYNLTTTISDPIRKFTQKIRFSNESLSLDVVRTLRIASFCSENKKKKKKRRGRSSEAYRYPFSSRHDVSKRFKCKCIVKSTSRQFRFLPRHLHANIVPVLVSITTRCFFLYVFFSPAENNGIMKLSIRSLN